MWSMKTPNLLTHSLKNNTTMVSETYIALVFNPTSIVYGKVQLTVWIDKTTTRIQVFVFTTKISESKVNRSQKANGGFERRRTFKSAEIEFNREPMQQIFIIFSAAYNYILVET